VRHAPRTVSRARFVGTALVPSLVVALAASAALASSGATADHVHASAAHGHSEDHEPAAHDADASSHEGVDGAVSGEGHVHAPCEAPVTGAEQSAADALVAETRATLARWSDFDAAVADGFTHITPDGRLVVHYGRADWIDDGRVLDPRHPESLVYAFPPRGEPVLLGAMYLTEADGAQPQVAGCLVQWHTHTNLCVAPRVGMVAVVDDEGSCPSGSVNEETRAMVHVWAFDLSTGPFSELDELDRDEVRAAVASRGS
jgi:hypothetical protein